MAEYYAIITHLDRQVGRIIRELNSRGLNENTYIIYTADHGLGCGEHGLMGKQNMYEHSMKPPLILIGPGIEGGRSSDLLVYLQDIMPTTLELSGIRKPDYVEFKSLAPAIRGEDDATGYPYLYGCYMDLQRMIRDDRYKMIAYPRAGIVRLYDLKNDAFEWNDLAGLDENQERIGEMMRELVKISKTLGDTLVISDYY